jgi:hypothetical protein
MTMPAEDLTIVKQAFAAFATRDLGRLEALSSAVRRDSGTPGLELQVDRGAGKDRP